ncbi:hypothetical protein pETSU_206 [Edwardsiella phage pEt-SU]|uniref:Uncharacterized protein n=1 Tax=Edwardsiella phage pEt-SU TaxID=2562142 RepID=A0A4D6DWP8_9CAUD|nr:hypothetical protein HOV39_gp206 [Edwardsiella phage pEt-SU]QBZ70787.1 hypothetical protein pETSU_206 [Edwardsiella phage pEt-SU]
MEHQVIDLRNNPPNQMTAMERAAVGSGYMNIRKQFEQIENSLYEVTLTVVNRPCENGKIYEITRDELDKKLQAMVNKHIGEIDHNAVKRAMSNHDTYSMARLRLATVVVEDSVGTLKSYSIDGIRDGSGSLVVRGRVWLSPRAEEMIKSGNYIFAMRSSIVKWKHNEPATRLDMIHGFDLLLEAEFDKAI